MKRILLIFSGILLYQGLLAQNHVSPVRKIDTVADYKVTVYKDARLDILAKVEADMNSYANRFTKGYRLFVLKSNNRDYAMKVRSYLLQNFPEEKVIMSYQSPFIKMKFGDFEEKKDAERYRDLILRGGVITGNIYIVPDTIELKPDRIGNDEQ